MKTIIKYTTAWLVVILFVANSTTFAQGGKANFSGTWAFNESKSTPSQGGPRMAATSMTITQDGNNLTVDRTSQGPDGEMKTTSKFTLDGKECVNTIFGDNTRKSVVTWSADGKALNFAHTMNFNGQEFKSTESWKINDDKTLAIETVFNGPNGEMKATNVYDKK